MDVDMHIHSIESDGTCTTKEIIELAIKNNVKAIALTDHDTIDGIKSAKEEADKLKFEFIPGIEISCNEYNLDIHVLGYYLDLKDEEFLREIELLKLSREARNLKIIEKFKKIGIIIDMEELKKMAPGNIISRLHFANYLVSKEIVSSKEEAFSKYLGKDGLAYEEKEDFPPEKAVKIIKANGGIVSLAHPLLVTKNHELLEKIIDNLKKYGLDALEVNYPAFTKADRKYLKKLAKKHGLLITGGSDFHGENRLGIHIGDGGLEYSQFEKIKEKAKGGY